MKISIDKDKCDGCGLCEVICPENFEMDKGGYFAVVKNQPDDGLDEQRNCLGAADSCPVEAITVE